MRLSELVKNSDVNLGQNFSDIDIRGLTADSRKIQPGFLFAALPGSAADGRAFIADAIARGATAVLAPDGTAIESKSTAVVTAGNPRQALARFSAAFYGQQPAKIAAVTGTNGKTSVAAFTQQLWTALGDKAAALGTLGLIADGEAPTASLTTPDPVQLHETLSALKKKGFEHVVMEASSHGLHQYRLDGVQLCAAGFTNLTRDHLDYHKSFSAYKAAKLRLFSDLLPRGATAVVPADGRDIMDELSAIAKERQLNLVTYGSEAGDIHCASLEPHDKGSALTLSVFGQLYTIDFPLPGLFQVLNALCALGLVVGSGAEASAAAPKLAGLQGVPGRLEYAGSTNAGAPIYIDYAHTPDALETVLSAMRPHVEKRLAVVFGCGGDRDKGKRPLMGGIAARLADGVYVTDDNPRTEDPGDIRGEITAGCPGANEYDDRAVAIKAAIHDLREGDCLIVAGKGHETGQIFGTERIPFNDADVVRKALSELGGDR